MVRPPSVMFASTKTLPQSTLTFAAIYFSHSLWYAIALAQQNLMITVEISLDTVQADVRSSLLMCLSLVWSLLPVVNWLGKKCCISQYLECSQVSFN